MSNGTLDHGAGTSPGRGRFGISRRPVLAAGVAATITLAAGLGFTGSRLTASAAEPNCTSASPNPSGGCLFGGFEIDGNTVSDGNTDWTSSAVTGSGALTNFYDLFNSTSDDIMSNGSKESDQTTWSCVNSKPPGKADLGGPWYTSGQFAPSGGKSWAGSIWFENTHPGLSTNVQYLFGNMQRFTTTGDVHLDFEFNKASTTLSGSCGTLPDRSQGDVLITFDTNNGGAQIFVSAFTFVCSTTVSQGTPCPGNTGSFQVANNLVAGSTFDGTANISPALTDSGVQAGAFGEAGLDLTHTIGSFSCGEFGEAWMKTRSAGTSDIANGKAEVKDFTAPVPFNPGLCPNSQISKAQKDVTLNDANYNQDCSTADQTAGTCASGAAPPPEQVQPGDTVQYQLTYSNTGGGPATGVTVNDSIPANTTYVANSCSPACTTTGSPVTGLTWNLGTQAAGATVTMTFQVTVISTFQNTNTITIENHATVSATGESTKTSNYVAVQTHGQVLSALSKGQADVQPSVQYCNTATGGAASSNAACASVPGTLNSNPTFVSTPIPVTPGDVIEYQLTYTNNGNAPATTVVITDSIPAHSTYVASSAACDATCTVGTTGTPVTSVSWTYASVGPGVSKHVTFEVTLASAFANGTVDSVSNSGSVTTDQDNTSSNTVVANITATGALALIKSASVSGKQITYTITYFNTGNGNLTGQTISDVIPSGLSFVSCSGGTGSCANNSGTVTWTVDAAAGTTAASPAGTLTLVVQAP